jgi:hypothetical protein
MLVDPEAPPIADAPPMLMVGAGGAGGEAVKIAPPAPDGLLLEFESLVIDPDWQAISQSVEPRMNR